MTQHISPHPEDEHGSQGKVLTLFKPFTSPRIWHEQGATSNVSPLQQGFTQGAHHVQFVYGFEGSQKTLTLCLLMGESKEPSLWDLLQGP